MGEAGGGEGQPDSGEEPADQYPGGSGGEGGGEGERAAGRAGGVGLHGQARGDDGDAPGEAGGRGLRGPGRWAVVGRGRGRPGRPRRPRRASVNGGPRLGPEWGSGRLPAPARVPAFSGAPPAARRTARTRRTSPVPPPCRTPRSGGTSFGRRSGPGGARLPSGGGERPPRRRGQPEPGPAGSGRPAAGRGWPRPGTARPGAVEGHARQVAAQVEEDQQGSHRAERARQGRGRRRDQPSAGPARGRSPTGRDGAGCRDRCGTPRPRGRPSRRAAARTRPGAAATRRWSGWDMA